MKPLPLPKADPSQLPSGSWVLRVVIDGERIRLPLCDAGALPKDVKKAHAKVLSQWSAIVERYRLKRAELKPAEPQVGTTFGEVAKMWWSGELAKRFPKHVKRRRAFYSDICRMQKHVMPHLKDKPIETLTLDDVDACMSALPETLSQASGRLVAQNITRVIALAVYPLKLRAASPIPAGWLPKLGPKKAMGWLYPDEERALVSSPKTPLHWALLYGVLAREGMRVSEARGLEWSAVDLERGVVTLDENKTDEPRVWALAPDVVRALEWWRKRHPDAVKVFVDDEGNEHGFTQAAETMRDHLQAAGVTRAELFERSETRQPVRLHDLRASFATLALANDRSERWVRDRTGHTTDTMLERYRRAARTAKEIGLPWFAPLDVLLTGRLPAGHADGHGAENVNENAQTHCMPYSRAGSPKAATPRDPAATSARSRPVDRAKLTAPVVSVATTLATFDGWPVLCADF